MKNASLGIKESYRSHVNLTGLQKSTNHDPSTRKYNFLFLSLKKKKVLLQLIVRPKVNIRYKA